MMALRLRLHALVAVLVVAPCWGFQSAWFPVAAKSALGINTKHADDEVAQAPTAIEIAGDEYVVWKAAGKPWSVMTDACSHRMAPLSAGRVDPATGCVECPYHGWQFDSAGAVTKIPQAPNQGACAKAAKARSYPTHVTGDVVWAYLPTDPRPTGEANAFRELPHPLELWAEAQGAPDHPDKVRQSERLYDSENCYVRELPYSWDYLIENFMDPGHVPFAHHGMQGVREDGSPIAMKVLESDERSLVVSFEDKIRGKRRKGRAVFEMPCHYYFQTKDAEDALGPEKVGLCMFCIPVSPGRSRLIIPTYKSSPQFLRKFPLWASHIMSNKFIDTDAWLQDCERRVVAGYQYNSMSSSDIGADQWRVWWEENLKGKPLFGDTGTMLLQDGTPKQTKEEYLSWYESHVKNCVPCQRALKRAERARKSSYLMAAVPLVLGLDLPFRIAGLLAFVGARVASGKVIFSLAPGNQADGKAGA